jgi:hypothetical protein
MYQSVYVLQIGGGPRWRPGAQPEREKIKRLTVKRTKREYLAEKAA